MRGLISSPQDATARYEIALRYPRIADALVRYHETEKHPETLIDALAQVMTTKASAIALRRFDLSPLPLLDEEPDLLEETVSDFDTPPYAIARGGEIVGLKAALDHPLVALTALLLRTLAAAKKRGAETLVSDTLHRIRRIPSDDVTILTYNVFGIPPHLGGKAPGRFARIARTLKSESHSIVALQELWEKRTAVLLKLKNYPYQATGPKTPKLWRGSGLATISKYPIVSSAFFPFTRSTLLERYVRKGVLFTSIDTPLGIMHLYNTHLCADTSLKSSSSEEVRVDQCAEMLAIVRRLSGESDTPYVICGDLNSGERTRR